MSEIELLKTELDVNIEGQIFKIVFDVLSNNLYYVSEIDFSLKCTNFDYLFQNKEFNFILIQSKNQFLQDVYLIKFENKEEFYNLRLDNIKSDINNLQRFINFTIIQAVSILTVIYYYLINVKNIHIIQSQYTKDFLLSQNLI